MNLYWGWFSVGCATLLTILYYHKNHEHAANAIPTCPDLINMTTISQGALPPGMQDRLSEVHCWQRPRGYEEQVNGVIGRSPGRDWLARIGK